MIQHPLRLRYPTGSRRVEKVKSAGRNLEIIVKLYYDFELIVLGFAYMLKEVVAGSTSHEVCLLFLQSLVQSENKVLTL